MSLSTIYLDGELGQLFGRKWKLRVATPTEALSLIEANRPGLAAYLARSGDRGIDWRIRVNGESVAEDRLHFRRPGAQIRITPVVRGAKSKLFGLVLGVALVALTWGAGAGLLGTGMQSFFGATAFGIKGMTVASLVGGVGISMAIGGIANLLSPQPDQPSSDPGKPSYIFGGPATVNQQGGPVPLCYGGPIIIGPVRISAGVYSEQIAAKKLPTNADLPGPDPEGEGGFSISPTLSVYTPGSPTPGEQQLKAMETQTLQIARMLDLLCEGEIAGLCDAEGTLLSYNDRLKATFFDRTPVRAPDGTLAFKKFATAFRPGTARQDWLAGFPAAEQQVSVGQEIIHGADKLSNAVQRQIAGGTHDAVRIAIRLPALFQYDDMGNRNGAAVHITIQAKPADDSVWQEIVGSAEANGEMDGLIGGECVQDLVINYRLPLSGAATWDVRVIRETADADDPLKLANRTYWDSYTLITDQKLRYPHSVIAGTELSAQAFQSIPEVAWRIKGKLVKVPSNYDPEARDYAGAWDGSFAGCDLVLTADYAAGGGALSIEATSIDLPDNALIEIKSGLKTWQAHLIGAQAAGATSLPITPIPYALPAATAGYAFVLKWTNNPAWIFYDLLTHRRYGLGQYVAPEQVDAAGLYAIARYCDGVDDDGNFVGVPDGNGGYEPRFTCNLHIGDVQDAYRVLQDLASVFRGMVFWGAGAITVAQDSPKTPIFLFTDANVIDGSFNYSGTSRKSRHSMAMITFSDPDNFFAQDVEVVEDPDLIDRFGVRQATATAFGCTSRSQANRVGRWMLTSERLETQTATFRVPIEGARVRLGDIIDIRDRYKSVNRMGGRLSAVDATAGTVTLDSDVTLTADEHTLLVSVGAGGVRELTVTNGAGAHRLLTVTGDLSDIAAPGVWILRNDTVEPFTARVIEVRELEDHTFEITALEYAADKYADVEAGVTAVPPPTSDLPGDDAPAAPTDLSIEEIIVSAPAGTQRQLYLSWSASTSRFVKGYKVEFRAPGRDWEVFDAQHKASTLSGIPITSIGQYAVRVSAIGYTLALSQPLVGTHEIAEINPPDPCTSLTATAGPELIDLQWTPPADPDLLTVEIFESTTSDLGDAILIQSFLGTRYVRQNLASGAQRWYWVRAVNRSSLRSTYAGPATATAAAGPMAAVGDALTAANGKNKIYRQAAAPDPGAVALVAGDVWFASGDDNRASVWDGSTWVASWTPMLKFDGATGRVTGLQKADGTDADFILVADKFQIWNGTSAIAPFFVADGVVYIQNSVIADASIGDAKITALSASKLDAGTITGKLIKIAGGSSGVIQSDNYVPGSTGWKIDGNGNAEFNAVSIRVSNYVTASGGVTAVTDGGTGSYSPTGGAHFDSGRPINVGFVVAVHNLSGSATTWNITIQLFRSTTRIGEATYLYTVADGTVQFSAVATDYVSAGIYSYSAKISASVASGGTGGQLATSGVVTSVQQLTM